MNIPDEVRAQMEAEWAKVWPEVRKGIPGIDELPPDQQAEAEQQIWAQHLEISFRMAQGYGKGHKQACEECAKLVDALIKAQATSLSGPMVLRLQALAAAMRELGSALDEDFG